MDCSLIIIISLFLAGCNSPENTSRPVHTGLQESPQDSTPVLLSMPDAEKILGEPAHLADSTLAQKGVMVQYNLTFTANVPEENTGKTGNLYYMLEQYDQASTAQASYASIKKANENHEGIKTLQDLGDEAYFHSDGENFCFILVRKGNALFRMKVNKLTGHTSLDEFNRVAASIAGAL